MSDYLFDKQGEPDPDVVELEQLLRPLAYRGAPPRRQRRRAPRLWLSGATVALAAAIVLLVMKPWAPHPKVDGAPPLGAWIDSGERRLHLAVGDIGTVDLAPRTRARFVTDAPTLHKIELVRGTLVATIVAPPRRFVVQTPRAVVTDLGCAFELTVDESGHGHLKVTAGKVALADGAAGEVVVAAGGESELGAPKEPHAAVAPSPPAPVAPAPPTPPIAPPAAKPHHDLPHSKTVKQPPPVAPPPTAAPTKKSAPPAPTKPTKIEHDSLKDLERSVP
jgi:ferric-dicitrate binding protein FerR (iron transport regulator)